MIKENSEDAYSLMIDKYMPIIKRIADDYLKQYANLNMDREELIQEGIMGLINAINSFVERKNCIFYTYAILLIRREMMKHIRTCSRGKNLILTLSKSIYDDVYENELFFEDTLYRKQDLVEEEVLSNYYDSLLYYFKYKLDNNNSLIYELKINNFSNGEIAKLLSLSYKKVDNNWRLIKKKLLVYLQDKI